MFKRILLVALCFGITLYMSSYSFSQDTEVKEEKKTEDMSGEVKVPGEKKDDATTPVEPAKPVASALEAKTFFDGVTVFANSKVLFKLTTKDNVDAEKIEYKINDGAFQAYGDPFAIADEGKQTITFFATDKLGNKEDEKFFRVTIDNTAPVVSLMADKPLLKVGEKIFASKAISFSVDAKDGLSGVEKTEYSINDGAYSPYVTPFNLAGDGETTLKIKSTDNVTNVSEIFSVKVLEDSGKQVIEVKEAALKLFIDNTAPAVEIKASKDFIEKDGRKIAATDYEYTITATDEESGVEAILVRLDGKGDFAPYKDALKFTSNGEHLVEAKAVDKMGNESKISILSVFVDVIPPVSTIEAVTGK